MTSLYDRVAARCARVDIPVSAACVADIDRYLAEERAALPAASAPPAPTIPAAGSGVTKGE